MTVSRLPGDRASAISRFSTSLRLFVRARAGDSSALSRLFARLLPSLQRWTRRRLPSWARRRMDTGDLVQDAFLNLFRRMGQIEPRRQGALRAYLQESIRNRIRDEVRRAGLVETSQEAGSGFADTGPSPLDRAMASESAERYRKALARLEPGDQELIVGRIELEFSYEQLALSTGRSSPDAARVAVRRALLRLAQEVRSA
jgi:RNA polymerase sigma factor (sigma-70 family)